MSTGGTGPLGVAAEAVGGPLRSSAATVAVGLGGVALSAVTLAVGSDARGGAEATAAGAEVASAAAARGATADAAGTATAGAAGLTCVVGRAAGAGSAGREAAGAVSAVGGADRVTTDGAVSLGCSSVSSSTDAKLGCGSDDPNVASRAKPITAPCRASASSTAATNGPSRTVVGRRASTAVGRVSAFTVSPVAPPSPVAGQRARLGYWKNTRPARRLRPPDGCAVSRRGSLPKSTAQR